MTIINYTIMEFYNGNDQSLTLDQVKGRALSVEVLMRLARSLLSEGENPEYDRAISELVTDAAGLSMECKDDILKAIRKAG